MAQDHQGNAGTEPNLDLKTLQSELHSMCTKWFKFGVQLGVDFATLKRIEKEFRDDVARCLLEMLNEWLKDKPSWKDMVEALKSPVIAEETLANKLERKVMRHSSSQSLSPTFSIRSSLEFPQDQVFPDHGCCDTFQREPSMHHVHSVPAKLESAEHTQQHRHRALSVPCCLPESDSTHKPLSKELEEKFLPSIQELREKGNIEREIETHRRHYRVVNGMHEGLISGKQTSEKAQVLKEILQEKEQSIDRLELEVAMKEPAFIQADADMKKLRTELDESMEHRKPLIKKPLKGAWRIISIGDGKLLATVDDGIGRVALLERRGDKLLELEKQVVHRDDEDTCSWTPAGIAVSGNDIFVGDASGAVPCDRVRKHPLYPTAQNSQRQELIKSNANQPQRGKSRIFRFNEHGQQMQEERTCFNDPSGMAFNRGNVLHVCDRADQSHQIVMLDTSLHQKGYYGRDKGDFLKPSAIDFDDDGSMFILDQGHCRVQVFSPEFQLLRTFGETVLHYPSYGILVTKEFVYVTQTNEKNCVSVFDKQSGVFVVSFGGGKLKDPVGITVDREGYIYVCDADHVWVF